MFDPAGALRENPALFACYVLFVYFRGVNAVRIEREMRGLGFTTFHRRNLYPRGKQPGWIARFGWTGILTAETQRRREEFRQDAQDRQDSGANTKDEYPVHPVHPVKNSSQRLGVSAVQTAQPDFHAWLKRVAPTMTWDWKHQQVIIKQLEKVTAGDCKRLMIFLPPRHGKTELVSVRYTAWRMQQDPSMNVILGSYNQRLADKMSRKIRTAICDSESLHKPEREQGRYQDYTQQQFKQDVQDRQDGKRGTNNDHPVHPVHPVPIPAEQGSPFPFSRPRPKNAVSEWETAAGGSFRAVGTGSGVTGFGANLLVIDDPVKNRAQAESETFRNRVWDWYKDDLYTRLEPDGSIVLIQTRWHEDDLAGRLLRENLDDWTIINLPALSEADSTAETELKQDEQDIQDAAGGNTSSSECAPQPPSTNMKTEPLDHQEQHPAHPVHPVKTSRFEWRDAPDIALCPERFPVEALEQQRRQLGTYAFSALYQQRPTPAGGQIFKREWFKNIIDFAPPRPEMETRIRPRRLHTHRRRLHRQLPRRVRR